MDLLSRNVLQFIMTLSHISHTTLLQQWDCLGLGGNSVMITRSPCALTLPAKTNWRIEALENTQIRQYIERASFPPHLIFNIISSTFVLTKHVMPHRQDKSIHLTVILAYNIRGNSKILPQHFRFWSHFTQVTSHTCN